MWEKSEAEGEVPLRTGSGHPEVSPVRGWGCTGSCLPKELEHTLQGRALAVKYKFTLLRTLGVACFNSAVTAFSFAACIFTHARARTQPQTNKQWIQLGPWQGFLHPSLGSLSSPVPPASAICGRLSVMVSTCSRELQDQGVTLHVAQGRLGQASSMALWNGEA